MRNKLGAGLVGLLGVCAFGFVHGCSSTDATPVDASTADALAPEAAVPGADASVAVPCSDSIEAVYGDPGALTGEPGSVLKCAPDRVWPRAELEAFSATGGKPFTSGARVFRVTYRTERGTTPGTPGYSSALVFLPDTPTAGAPAVVVAHGTTGQGAACAPSKYKYETKGNSFVAMIFPIVGAGYPVIVPDYAGYANYGAKGNVPSGYHSSDDEGKSVLDGFRALRKIVPGFPSDKNIVVGHSQGGHAALSALAISETYGVPLSGVVTYAPNWMNQSVWGALFLLADQFPIETSAFTIAAGVWYHYSQAELFDGQGKGVDIFAADKRAAIKDFFDTACLGDTDKLKPLGTTVTDLYDPAFVGSVKFAAGGITECGATDETCKKWMARYAASRPHITGKATKVPQLVLYGTKDTTIPPDRAMCGFDRLKSDGATYKVCLSPDATHSGIVGARAGYVNDWIANVALGAPAPAPCDQDETGLTANGAQVKCASPPPNN